LVFLILLITATGVLLAWLLYAIARLALGDMRYQRVHVTVSRGSAGASEAAVRSRPTGSGAPSSAPEPAPDTVLYDESEAEQAIRERLYGRRGGMTRPPRD
jgi:hypothetical protein